MSDRDRGGHRNSSNGADLSGGTEAGDVAARGEAARAVERELEAWRVHAVPDAAAPLEAEDIARLLRDCLLMIGVDPAVGEGFSTNTVHYYRRKDILDAPDGRTSAARYSLRHLWQAVGARLAGHLGLLTLAEARSAMRRADDRDLLRFVASRVLDARGRHAVRRAPGARSISSSVATRLVGEHFDGGEPRPLRAALPAVAPHTRGEAAVLISLPGEAWCVLPASHPAHHSVDAARDVVRALAAALHSASDVILEP